MMKPFVTVRRFVFSRKSVVVPVVLSVLGLGVGGTFFAYESQQSLQFMDSVSCPSTTAASCTTAANTDAAGQHNQPTQTSFAVASQDNYLRHNPVRHSPAPDGAARIIPPSPTPVVTPAPVPTGQPGPGQAAVIAMIEQVFGPYAPGALQVAECESGYNSGAYNPTSIGGSHAEGVFQILYPSTWDTTSESASSPYDASANIHAAYEIFSRDGYNWHEWSCAA